MKIFLQTAISSTNKICKIFNFVSIQKYSSSLDERNILFTSELQLTLFPLRISNATNVTIYADVTLVLLSYLFTSIKKLLHQEFSNSFDARAKITRRQKFLADKTKRSSWLAIKRISNKIEISVRVVERSNKNGRRNRRCTD